MYAQLPGNIPHITIPRQPTVGAYQSPAGTGPPTGKDISPTAGSNGAAAPGPIPATIPKILQDSDGIQRIVFEYSKDKHRTTYQIRCDTNTVDVDALPIAFKEANLVYPRAYRKENYGGNRYSYESECNNIGWALTHLNPELRENRGATQRAVDSWRNSSSDPKMRSRRVRRQAKQQKRVTMQQQVQQASAQVASVGGVQSGGALATQRPLPVGEGAARDEHQYQLPAMKSDDGKFRQVEFDVVVCCIEECEMADRRIRAQSRFERRCRNDISSTHYGVAVLDSTSAPDTVHAAGRACCWCWWGGCRSEGTFDIQCCARIWRTTTTSGRTCTCAGRL